MQEVSSSVDPSPELVREIVDDQAGLHAFLVVDSTDRGPAAGGIRRASYGEPREGLREARRLASLMTSKCALADLPAGGAKTVILDREDLDVPAAFRAIGRAVEGLGGRYLCGPDVGTGEAELDHVRAVTSHVNPAENDPNAATASGVLAGLRGVLSTLEDRRELAGSRFVVQGLGGVGLEVSRRLQAAGAQVLGTDVREQALVTARRTGIETIAPEDATRTVCDVFVPCAMGDVLTAQAAENLPARGVCGSANGPLASARAGQSLHDRGVAYAPDILVNAGAVIEGVLTAQQGRSPSVLETVEERIAGIEDRVVSVLEASREMDRPPAHVAVERAEQALDEG